MRLTAFAPPFPNADWLLRIFEFSYWLSLLSLLFPWLQVPDARGSVKIDKKRGSGKLLGVRKKTGDALCYGRIPKYTDFCWLGICRREDFNLV